MNRALLLLALCQGFFLTTTSPSSPSTAWSASRSRRAWLATLPVTAYVAGGALFAGLVARHQRAWGRRRAFQVGLVVAVATTALCAWAATHHRFWMLVLGTLLAGYYNANAGLYRFAATEIVAPEFRERAISWVLAGGILGAVAGPNLARSTRNLLPTEFARAYAALALVALARAGDDVVDPLPAARRAERRGAGPAAQADRPATGVRRRRRRLRVRLRRDESADGGDADRDGDVLASLRQHRARPRMARARHVRSELLPRQPDQALRALPIMAAGVVLDAVCIAVALSGIDLAHFLVTLLTLGVGWNFLFIGGTALVTTAYRPEEKTRAQAAMDTTIFATTTVTSFSSGALVTTQG